MSQYYYEIGSGDDTEEIEFGLDLAKVEASHHKKLMNRTLLITNTSNTKQVSIDYKKHIVLSQLAKNLNKKTSQGVIVYESLHFDREEFHDIISDAEQKVDDKLNKYNINIEKVNNLTWIRKEELNALVDEIELPPNFDDTIRPSLYIPKKTIQQAPWSRYWGQKIIDSVFNMYCSVYSDRLDRIQCKRELVNYLDSKKKPDHPVARVITGFEETSVYNAGEIKLEAKIESIDDLKKNADNFDTWEKRYNAIHELRQSMNYNNGFTTYRRIISDVWEIDYSNKSYIKKRIKKYAEKYDDNEILSEIFERKVENMQGQYRRINTQFNITSADELIDAQNSYAGDYKLEYYFLDFLRNVGDISHTKLERIWLKLNYSGDVNDVLEFDYVRFHDGRISLKSKYRRKKDDRQHFSF